MSNINTNGINVNYPVPGVNNNSQGFRDNFASIATNLNSAATEITDLQNKVVVKQALTGTTINNDMANTLISNASTRSFRATTYNLGNALVGTVLVDVSLADVHYGTVAGNTTVNFGSWAPSGTQSNVQVNLSISNNLSTITFSGNIVLANANTNGASTLENFANVGGLVTVTVPNGVSQLNYLVSTTDCGNTLYISPINRPRVATAIQNRSPIPTGFQGDVLGDVAADADYMYVCTGSYDASIVTKTSVVQTYASGNKINCTSTSGLFANAPIIFSGTGFGNIVAGATYYIKTIPDGANITISQDGFSGIVGNAVALSDATGSMSANSYNGTSIWQSINLAVATGTDTTTGNLTVTNNANIGNNLTVVGNTTSGNFIGTFANGTSNINIPAVNGNINVVVAGTQRLVLSGGGANITGTANVSGALTAGGNISTFGTNGVVQANNITVTGAASGSANVASLTGSLGIRAITSTYTDSTAAASSTVIGGAIHAIGAPVLAASNASVTFTNASTFLIGGAPSAGANVTITNPYALTVSTGNSYFGGTGNFTGNVTIASSGSKSLTINAQSAGLAQIKLTSNTTGGPDSYITSTLATGGLHLQTNSTTGLFIDSSQNVGVGTNLPTALLDVNGNVAITGAARRITGDFSNATYQNRVLFQTSTVNSGTSISAIPNGNPGVEPSNWAVFGSSDINNSSYVLMAINSTQSQIASGNTGTGTILPLTFYVGNNERMRIDSSGNLGIGVTPSTWTAAWRAVELATAGSSVFSNGLSSVGLGQGWYNNSGSKYAQASYAVGAYQINAGSHQFLIAAIGTVDAAVSFTTAMTLDTDGSLILQGSTAQKATGTTWSNPSDQRLKENVRDFSKGTTELMQVRVREWEYNGKAGTTAGMKGIGVVADEVMLVLPDTVSTYNTKLNTDDEETTEIKQFDATEITWLLVKTVQEQQALITNLTARIEALEST